MYLEVTTIRVVLLLEDYAEMARVKLNYFNQSLITSERIELKGCGLYHSLANLKSCNFLTNFSDIWLILT